MPSLYAHQRISSQVFSFLPKPAQQKILPYKELFDLGALGSDILLPAAPRFFRFSSENRSRLNCVSDEFFLRSAHTIISKSEDPEACCAYLCGMLCHFLTDSFFHGCLKKHPCSDKISIARIEKEFDRMLMEKDFCNPLIYSLTDHIVPSEFNACIISEIFSEADSTFSLSAEISPDDIIKKLNTFILCNRRLRTPYLVKRLITRCFMTVTGRRRLSDKFTVSLIPDPRCRKICRSLLPVFESFRSDILYSVCKLALHA